MSQADLARILPLTTRQIRNLEADGLPHRADGNRKWYPIPEAVVWWRDREVAAALAGVQVSDLDRIKERKLEAEAAAKELELAERRGQLMRAAAARHTWAAVLTRLRSKVISFMGALAPQMVGLENPREAKAILDRAMNELLAELRETADELEDDEEEDEESEAA